MAFWNEVVNAEELRATNYLCLAETIRALKGVECTCYNGTMLHVTMKQSVHSKGLNAHVTMLQWYNGTMLQCFMLQ